MTTNLLSVIEQQHKALEELLSVPNDDSPESVARCILSHTKARKAIAAGNQALEQTQADVYAEVLDVEEATRGLLLEGLELRNGMKLYTHPQATEPRAQASEIARLMARAKMDSSLHEMSLATIQTLQDVSAEYNAWIRFHSAGGDYDDFLKQYGAFNE